MSYTINLLGLDTYEILSIGEARAASVLKWPLEKHPGPTLLHRAMGGDTDRFLYLYPQHLELLYHRFRLANPKGVETGANDWYAAKPANRIFGQQTSETYDVWDFEFVYIADAENGYRFLRSYLPEIFEPSVITEMANDPWLDVALLRSTLRAGVIPSLANDDARWSLEWRKYCDSYVSDGKRSICVSPR